MIPILSRRACLGLLAGAAVHPRLAAAAGASLVDLMPAFWAVYDAACGASPDERARRLDEGFFQPHAADYRRAGLEPTPASIRSWLAGFDLQAAQVRAVADAFAADYGRRLGVFRRALADFDPGSSPVSLMPSLCFFDGHLEPDGRSLPLFFGPDGIVKYHGAQADLDVLFSHELFHCYQGQRNPAMMLDPAPPVFSTLWQEGCATYASERLNPGASLLHVLLDDEALARTDAAVLRRVAGALRQRLDSTKDEDQLAFFTTGSHGDWPSRAGYYVGLLLARQAGTRMELGAMAALPMADVRALLARGLDAMLRGGEPRPASGPAA